MRLNLPSKSLLGSVASNMRRVRAAFLLQRRDECERADEGWTAIFHLPELGESELSSPDLALAAKTVSANELEPENAKESAI